MQKLQDLIDATIRKAVQSYDGSYVLGNPFERLLSFGELVDRLAIVNFKLYTLKDKTMDSNEKRKEFRAWAAMEDIRLVEERARLKRCIDEKLLSMIDQVLHGDPSGGFNAEVKKYGS